MRLLRRGVRSGEPVSAKVLAPYWRLSDSGAVTREFWEFEVTGVLGKELQAAAEARYEDWQNSPPREPKEGDQ